MSAVQPPMWTTWMARVFGRRWGSIVAAVTFNVRASTSARRGRAPR